MQQKVFNPLLLYFQLVHFYNNAEKKRKSFRGKTPAFFWAFFSRRDCFSDREEQTEHERLDGGMDAVFAHNTRLVHAFAEQAGLVKVHDKVVEGRPPPVHE